MLCSAMEGLVVSKLGCICGHIIRDQSDRLPYKGYFLRDFDEEFVFEAIQRECEALVEAVAAGDRESWFRRHFTESYPRRISNGSAFCDFVSGLFLDTMGTLYECEACGRIWARRPGAGNEFTCYLPESGRPERVLRSPRDHTEAEGGEAR